MCIKSIMRLVLVLVNLAVALAGIALVVLGALLVWGQSLLSKVVQPFVEALQNANIKNTVETVEVVNYMLKSLKYVGFPVFILGLFILIIAVCGMCGACCSFNLFLIVYAVATGVIASAQIICLIVIFAKKDGFIQTQLESSIKDFRGQNITNAQTFIWTIVQSQLQCCGVQNGSNYDKVNFNHVFTYNKTVSYNITYPDSCCKMDSTFKIQDWSCVKNGFTDANSNINTGCYPKLTSYLTSYSTSGLVIMILVIVAQLALVLFALYIIKS